MIAEDGFEYTHINGPCPKCKNAAATLQINERNGQARCVGAWCRWYAGGRYGYIDKAPCGWQGRLFTQDGNIGVETAPLFLPDTFERWAAAGIRA